LIAIVKKLCYYFKTVNHFISWLQHHICKRRGAELWTHLQLYHFATSAPPIVCAFLIRFLSETTAKSPLCRRDWRTHIFPTSTNSREENEEGGIDCLLESLLYSILGELRAQLLAKSKKIENETIKGFWLDQVAILEGLIENKKNKGWKNILLEKCCHHWCICEMSLQVGAIWNKDF
jgi:hypothetical protein